jgi:alpha-glucosidase (family GH31 glycosyl hydrolase)
MALQFSYAPFHYDKETIGIAHKMLALRANWLPYMLAEIDAAVGKKEPPFR